MFELVGALNNTNNSNYEFIKMAFFIITIVSCFISIIDALTKLRDNDVLNGKAEYVETIHISKGDTIKIYHIEAKEEK